MLNIRDIRYNNTFNISLWMILCLCTLLMKYLIYMYVQYVCAIYVTDSG